MGDTLPCMHWSLQRPCIFRHGEQWFLPDRSHQQLCDLHVIDSAERRNRCLDGILVTTVYRGRDKSGRNWDDNRQRFDVPLEGFRIADRYSPDRELPMIRGTCGKCEANVEGYGPSQVAGCFGTVVIHANAPEEVLWHVIRKHKWDERLKEQFQVTCPLWYSFWIDSPLTSMQTELLHEILSTANEVSPMGTMVRSLLAALKTSLECNIPLHVAHSPPGHVDFGWYTAFPHCPRCKAGAPVEPWQATYSTELHTCAVCGHAYRPNDNYSQRSDGDVDVEEADPRLSRVLGDDYLPFVKRFLVLQGISPEKADKVLEDVKSGRRPSIVFE